jgi:hypothetical protein
MEIQTLKLHVTDRDLEALVAKAAARIEGVQDLKARFTPAGVVVTGKYPTSFLTVSFETTWAAEPAGSELRVSLAALKVMGIPGGFLRGVLMKIAKDQVGDEPGVRVEGDTVFVRPAEMVKRHGIELSVNFTRVTFAEGSATAEAG